MNLLRRQLEKVRSQKIGNQQDVMALNKAKVISEDVTTFERFLKFPFKKVQTKVSVKYDLSPEYVEQIFAQIDNLYIKLKDNYDRKSDSEKFDFIKSLDAYSQQLDRPLHFIKPYCPDHRLMLGFYVDGHLRRKNILMCRNCFFWHEHPQQLGDFAQDYFGAVNKAVQAELNKRQWEAHKFFREERNRLWWHDYNTYLNSDRWKIKRAAVLDRDKYICQGCLQNKATQVHHLSYKRVFNEPLFDLVAICDDCHELCHDH